VRNLKQLSRNCTASLATSLVSLRWVVSYCSKHNTTLKTCIEHYRFLHSILLFMNLPRILIAAKLPYTPFTLPNPEGKVINTSESSIDNLISSLPMNISRGRFGFEIHKRPQNFHSIYQLTN
jgi:hypothetical protein